MKMKVCLLGVFVILLFSDISINAAAVSSETVNKAYVSMIRRKMMDNTWADRSLYSLYDFNDDGIEELITIDVGARAAMDLYTYQNGKVIKLTKDYYNGLGYIKINGKKYIVGSGSRGMDGNGFDILKIEKGKLKLLDEYWYGPSGTTKNGKKISAKEYDKISGKTKYIDLKEYQVKRKYVSPQSIGIRLDVDSSSYEEMEILGVDSKYLYYKRYEYEYGEQYKDGYRYGDNYNVVITDCKKRISGSTKFYYGDYERLDKGLDTSKWLMQVSKKKFISLVSENKKCAGKVLIKNGKVTKVMLYGIFEY